MILKIEIFENLLPHVYILETIWIYFYCFCFWGLFLIFWNKAKQNKNNQKPTWID